tara:strand:- start:352 stop:465 length:114 start_codon:yes stop_codon:yes gene_type:complete
MFESMSFWTAIIVLLVILNGYFIGALVWELMIWEFDF